LENWEEGVGQAAGDKSPEETSNSNRVTMMSPARTFHKPFFRLVQDGKGGPLQNNCSIVGKTPECFVESAIQLYSGKELAHHFLLKAALLLQEEVKIVAITSS